MKICPYMSHRSSPGYAQEVECIEKRCAIYEKCQEKYTLIDIADEKYDPNMDKENCGILYKSPPLKWTNDVSKKI